MLLFSTHLVWKDVTQTISHPSERAQLTGGTGSAGPAHICAEECIWSTSSLLVEMQIEVQVEPWVGAQDKRP